MELLTKMLNIVFAVGIVGGLIAVVCLMIVVVIVWILGGGL